MASSMQSTSYTLHMFPFSLYSLMAKFTWVLGRSTAPDARVDVAMMLVNLHRDENVSEAYLVGINPKGQVPALTGGELARPLTDSLDISYFFCKDHFPALLPAAHESTIANLLGQLHAIRALSLSVPQASRQDREVPCPRVDELLASDQLGSAYRQALEFKRA